MQQDSQVEEARLRQEAYDIQGNAAGLLLLVILPMFVLLVVGDANDVLRGFQALGVASFVGSIAYSFWAWREGDRRSLRALEMMHRRLDAEKRRRRDVPLRERDG